MFKELDVVKTTVKKTMPAESIDTIVSIHSSHHTCEVEFTDKHGVAITIETYDFTELEAWKG